MSIVRLEKCEINPIFNPLMQITHTYSIRLALFGCLILTALAGWSQDRIYLLDGRAIAGQVLEKEGSALKYQLPGRSKSKLLKSKFVQSIAYGDGRIETMVSLDRITLLNGKLVYGQVGSIGDSLVTYTVDKAGAAHERKLETARVFAVLYASGREEVVYQMDSMLGNVYSTAEMRRFVVGAQDAWVGYKPFGIGTFAFVSSSVLSYAVGGNMLTWLAAPAGYGLAMGAIRIRGNKLVVKDKSLLTDEAYIDGYSMVARGIKHKYAMFGAILGTGAGYAVVKGIE